MRQSIVQGQSCKQPPNTDTGMGMPVDQASHHTREMTRRGVGSSSPQPVHAGSLSGASGVVGSFYVRLAEFKEATSGLRKTGRNSSDWSLAASSFAVSCVAEFGLSQAALGRALGVSKATVHRWLYLSTTRVVKVRRGRDEFVALLRTRPGLLASDIAEHFGMTREQSAKRLVEYERRGWVRRGPTAPRDNSMGGRAEAITWYATDKLPPPINVKDIAKQRVVKNNAPNRDARIPKVIARLSDLEQAWLGAG